MKRRRFLHVPSSIDEWKQEGNAYSKEEDWSKDLRDRGRVKRPLPSSQILASAPLDNNASGKSTPFVPSQAPFLRDFYNAVGVNIPAKDDQPEETADDINYDNLEDIDNPSLSTLSIGQHRRYLQLTGSQQTDRRTAHERKELTTLRKIVNAERLKYEEALQKFFLNQKERFLTGFRSAQHPASGFCRWASSNQRCITDRWKNDGTALPMKFGKCRQIISFQSKASCTLDIDSIQFQVVHESQSNDVTAVTELPAINTRIPPPDNKHVNHFCWLKDDTKAHELATKYKVAILTTAETLEALLQLPGEYDSKWILYKTAVEADNSRITILDIPIAQSLLPRTCFEKGVQEGLYQLLDQEKKAPKYIYSLWTLPSTNSTSRRTPVRVLVRSAVRLVNKDGIPISLRVHAEYFPERGVENPSLHEKSLWILDQLLLEHKVKTCFARIYVPACQILQVEETSIAHAFASAANEASNPLLHWQALIRVLSSIPTIDTPEALLCLPGTEPSSSKVSASIHAPVDKNTPCVVVNLETILEQADAVALNADALCHCSRDWKWEDNERIPNTFPFNLAQEKKQS